MPGTAAVGTDGAGSAPAASAAAAAAPAAAEGSKPAAAGAPTFEERLAAAIQEREAKSL